jgi:hypothetical protein
MGVSLPPVAYERIHGRQRASVRGLEDDLEGGYLSKHRRHTCNSGSLPVSRSEVKRADYNSQSLGHLTLDYAPECIIVP